MAVAKLSFLVHPQPTFPAKMKILNLSVSPACITLTEKYTSQLLLTPEYLTTNAQILDHYSHSLTSPYSHYDRNCSLQILLRIRNVPYHPYVCFYQDFCNERPHSRIFQILIFRPQLYDYYLSSSIFDLKISYILNMLKSQPPPVFLKSFLLDDVKNKTEVS